MAGEASQRAGGRSPDDADIDRIFGDLFAEADRLAGQRAVSELLRNDPTLSPEIRAMLERSERLQSGELLPVGPAQPSAALLRWRIFRARLLYLSPLRHVFAALRQAGTAANAARRFTLPRLPEGVWPLLLGLPMFAVLFFMIDGMRGLATLTALGIGVVVVSLGVVMPLAKITTSLADEGENSPFLALWIFLFPTIGVGLLLKLFGMETGWAVVFAVLGGLFDLNYYYNVYLPRKTEEPAATGPHREAGMYGDGGYAYAHEFLAPEAAMHPDSPEQWGRSVYLQRFIEVYGQPVPLQAFALGYHGPMHGITIAPTRSGKGTAGMVPTVLLNDENVAQLDLKGETWFVTHKPREEAGHTVHVLNPWNLWGKELGYIKPMTARFNPLQSLRPDSPDFTNQIGGLAAALIMEQGKEPHFINRARQAVSGVSGHLCEAVGDAIRENFIRATIGLEENEPVNTMPVMRRILSLPTDVFGLWCETVVSGRPERVNDDGEIFVAIPASTVPLVRDNLAAFATPTKETASIISTALGQLGFLSDPNVIHFLSGSTFDFSMLRKPKNSVFIMLPPEQLRDNKNFARLIVQSMFNALWRQPQAGDASVLMILDEQYQLGYMEDLKNAPGLLSGYGVRMWSIFQNLGQLKDTFAEAWEGALANAGFIQIFTPNDMTTAEYFSRKIGKATAQAMNISGGSSSGTSENYGPNAQGGGSNSSGSSSGWSQSPAQVDAVTPQDLMGMGKDRGVLFAHGVRWPAITTRTPYFSDPEFSRWAYLPNPMRSEDRARAIQLGREWHRERTAAQARRVSRH